MRIFSVACALLWLVTFQTSQAETGGTGLQISVAGDTVGSFGSENGADGATNRLLVREAEFLFYAPVDHYFNAVLSFAAHYEEGELRPELHELYVENTTLIPRSRFRVGQYFLSIGRLNQFHRHDWPFITTPKVQARFFDEEGVLDTGLQYSYLFPTPFYLDLTVGLTNGWIYGHSHVVGFKPHVPTHYARLATYADLPGNGGMQAGLNYLGRKDYLGENTTLLGLDLVAKWREQQNLLWFFQGELWLKKVTQKGRDNESYLGFYLYPQGYLGANLFLGVRFDYYTHTSKKDGLNLAIPNYYLGLEPTLSWKPSEFSTFRLAYSHRRDKEGDTVVSNNVYLLQAMFILGAHPAHDF